jgi:hypothetical protein
MAIDGKSPRVFYITFFCFSYFFGLASQMTVTTATTTATAATVAAAWARDRTRLGLLVIYFLFFSNFFLLH